MSLKLFQLSLVFALFWLISACSSVEPSMTRQFYVFGTLVDVEIYGVDKDHAHAQAAISEIMQSFYWMHHNLHTWKGRGKLIRLNEAFAAGRVSPFDQRLSDLIKESRQFEQDSLGFFNPAIGGLVNLWGFHTDEYPILSAPPSKEAIQKFTDTQPSMQQIEVTDEGFFSSNKQLSLDFGGYAKGVAVDKAMEILALHGLKNAIVNAGGDLRVRGEKGERPWVVGVRHPVLNTPMASIEAKDGEAIFTSGNYYRFKSFNGKRYAHILNPETGMPVNHIASATVISHQGAIADAAATALVVAGAEHWRTIINNFKLKGVLLIDEAGVVYMDQAMQKRAQIIPKGIEIKVLD